MSRFIYEGAKTKEISFPLEALEQARSVLPETAV